MHSGSDRDAWYRQLRELHKLYNKCVPAKTRIIQGGLELGICSCGRLLKRPGQTYWSSDATRALPEGWAKVTHADKRLMARSARYKEYIRELRS